MILRSLVYRQHASLKRLGPSPCLNIYSASSSNAIRSRLIHTVPTLVDDKHDRRWQNEGIPGLFSPDAYDVAWTQYQRFMVDRLNTILTDYPARLRSHTVKDLILNTAREPSAAAVFNYASMAHNNHFFFSSLLSEETDIPRVLEENINRSFGSLQSFRETFLATAAGMFGPGFVWLVQDKQPSLQHPAFAASSDQSTGIDSAQIHLRVLTTYLAGTPYPGAHTRQQGKDMNVENVMSSEDYARQTRVQNTAGQFGSSSVGARGMASIDADIGSSADPRRFGGADVIPLLCLNTWEHCYLHDFGVAGKREYLARWWDRVNWDAVSLKCDQPPRHAFFT